MYAIKSKFVGMSTIDEIADDYVTRSAELDPVSATAAGIAGYDHLMTNLTPAGFEARAELTKRTLVAVAGAQASSQREQVAKASMIERLTVSDELEPVIRPPESLPPTRPPTSLAPLTVPVPVTALLIVPAL